MRTREQRGVMGVIWMVIMSTGFAGCAAGALDDEATGAREQASQCGPTWDGQGVERYDGTLGVTTAFVTKHERRVGYHLEGPCSGTLISDELFLSAGHCNYAVGHHVRFDHQVDASGVARAARDYEVIAVVESEESRDFDYAIVRLAGTPGRTYGHATIAPVDPPVASRVAVIGHPFGRPKEVATGPIFDYASARGANWLRYEVDTLWQSSGSGALDANGELVGMHTHAGCNVGAPILGNSAMRMSQLVPHSPVLRELVRTRLLWTHAGGAINLWFVNADGALGGWRHHGPFPGWTAVGLAQDRLTWQHTDGRVILWRLDRNGDVLDGAEHAPPAGWTFVAHANRRLLWRHTDGRVALWRLDEAGQVTGTVEHGPYAGWTGAGYANDRLLWRHTSGKLAIWLVDDDGQQLAAIEHGPFADWTALGHDNGDVLWRNTADQRTSQWQIDRTGAPRSYVENAAPGWTPVAWVDRQLLWHRPDGAALVWRVDGEGRRLSQVQHGPFDGWTLRAVTANQP